MSNDLQDLAIDELSGVDAPANSIPGWLVMKNGDVQDAAEAQLAAIYATLGGASVLEGAPEEIQKAAASLAEFAEKQLSAPEPEPSLIEKMKELFKAKRPVPSQTDDSDADDEPGAKNAKGTKPTVKKNKKTKRSEDLPAPSNGTADSQSNVEPDMLRKALKPLRKELRSALEEELTTVRKEYVASTETLREALVKALDRIEALEGELVGSYQVPGQDSTVQKSESPDLRAGIMSAFSGNRVTLH